MWSWLKPDPAKALRRRYEAAMKEAMDLQRRGDIPAFAVKDAEARAILAELEALEARRAPTA